MKAKPKPIVSRRRNDEYAGDGYEESHHGKPCRLVFGAGGIFAQEVKSALYNAPTHRDIPVFGFIAGLGGRDITPAAIREIIQYAETHDAPEDAIWIGVKA